MSDDTEIRTYFKLPDLVKWIGLTQFEILSNLFWFFVFTVYLTITLTLKDHANSNLSHTQYPLSGMDNITDFIGNHHSINTDRGGNDVDWFKLFIPLFCNDILNGYFCIIVSIRMVNANKMRLAFHRLFWSSKLILLTALFKYLLCLKLASHMHLEYSEVFSPIFILFVIFCSKLCNFPWICFI